MRWVKPKVFLIAKSKIELGYYDWLRHHGVSEPSIDRILSPEKTDAEKIIEGCGRRCYMSFEVGMNPNVSRIREDITQYIDNILASAHGSVIEHVTFTFAIENVSRVFTGEMNRHRAGVAISEGSMRFIRFNDIPIVEVPSLEAVPNDHLEAGRRGATRSTIEDTVAVIEKAYGHLTVDIWNKELAPESKFHNKKNVTSMLRRIVPMGVATGGVWTMNLRALRHVCAMRGSAAAEEEILVVANQILTIMREEEPNFFGDFKQNAEGYWEPKYKKV